MTITPGTISAVQFTHRFATQTYGAVTRGYASLYGTTSHQRSVLVYAPSWWQMDYPLPLLVALHGGGGSGRTFMQLTSLQDVAEQGFVLAAPDGLGSDVISVINSVAGETLTSLLVGETEALGGTATAGATDAETAANVAAQVTANGYSANTISHVIYLFGPEAGALTFAGTLASPTPRLFEGSNGWACDQNDGYPAPALFGVKTGVPETYANTSRLSEQQGLPDAEAIVAGIEYVCSQIPIDRQRIYVCGFSNGARMGHLLARQYPHYFAAMCLGGAGLMLTAYDDNGPNRRLPVHVPPTMTFHGYNYTTQGDLLADYGDLEDSWCVGNDNNDAAQLCVEATLQELVARRGGQYSSRIVTAGVYDGAAWTDEYDTSVDHYVWDCGVEHLRLNNTGHQWPMPYDKELTGYAVGLVSLIGYPNRHINMSQRVWDFCKRYRTQAAPAPLVTED